MTVANNVTEKIQQMIDLAVKFGANRTIAEKDMDEMYLFEAKLMIVSLSYIKTLVYCLIYTYYFSVTRPVV